MAITDFILTVAGVTAAVVLLTGDVKHSATTFRHNIRHICQWFEEESTSVAKSLQKEVNSQAAKKANRKHRKGN